MVHFHYASRGHGPLFKSGPDENDSIVERARIVIHFESQRNIVYIPYSEINKKFGCLERRIEKKKKKELIITLLSLFFVNTFARDL